MPSLTSKKVNFTKKYLEKLESTGKDYNVYDSKVSGLYLIVRAAGSKVFWIRRRLYGQQKKFKIGPFPDLSVENARKIAEDYKGKTAMGKNPVEEKNKLSKEKTFGEMAWDYIESYAKYRKKSWRDDAAVIKNHLGGLVNKRASAVTRADISTLHNKIGNSGHKVGANRIVEKIKAIYNWAIDNRGWEGENPATKINKFSEKSRKRILSVDEMPRFFKALGEEYNCDFKDFVMIALFTGVRRSNVLSMKWKDVELDSVIPIWKIEVTKNGDSQVVPLIPMLVEILKSRKEMVKDSKFVFPGTGKTGHYQDPKKAWARILKNAEIEGLVIHDLRRTIATVLSDNRNNQLTVQNILGHKTGGGVTSVYARTRLKTMFEALSEAGDIIIDEAGGIEGWW